MLEGNRIKKTKKMLEIERKIGELLEVFLRREYVDNKKSMIKIGASLDVDVSTIRNWLAKTGIKIREAPYGCKEWLQCADGHEVKNGYERRVDEWLYFNVVAHDYNKELPGARKYKFDFKVEDWYIKVWGLTRIDIFPDDFGSTNDWKKKLELLLEFSDPEGRVQRFLEDFGQ